MFQEIRSGPLNLGRRWQPNSEQTNRPCLPLSASLDLSHTDLRFWKLPFFLHSDVHCSKTDLRDLFSVMPTCYKSGRCCFSRRTALRWDCSQPATSLLLYLALAMAASSSGTPECQVVLFLWRWLPLPLEPQNAKLFSVSAVCTEVLRRCSSWITLFLCFCWL